MYDIALIQKEFEILVSELEKLKSINELSSANANNSATVVNATDGLVKNMKDFQEKLEKHYQIKENQLEKLTVGFSKALEVSDKSIQEQQEKFSKSVITSQEKSWHEVKARMEDMQVNVLRFLNEVNSVKSEFKNNLDDFVREYLVKLGEFQASMIEELAALEKLNILEKILTHLNNQKKEQMEHNKLWVQRFLDLERLINQKTNYQRKLQILLIVLFSVSSISGLFLLFKYVI